MLIDGLGTTLYNDTWEWDGSNWMQIQTQNAPPVGIFGGSIAYDSVRQKVVFFGGRLQ